MVEGYEIVYEEPLVDVRKRVHEVETLKMNVIREHRMNKIVPILFLFIYVVT
jgi:hypothetical protein